jgi:hypothetical protein
VLMEKLLVVRTTLRWSLEKRAWMYQMDSLLQNYAFNKTDKVKAK